MSRSVFTFSINSIENTQNAIDNLLIANNYKKNMEQEGIIWKKGNAFFTGERCIKLIYNDTKVTVEAWIGNGFSELDLTGIVGALAKRQVLKVIEQIKLSIT